MAHRQQTATDVVGPLQLAQASWEAVFTSARDAIISTDREGRVTLFNPMAERMFGYRAQEMLGQDMGRLIPRARAGGHTGHIGDHLQSGFTEAVGRVREVEARRRNGEVFPIELSVAEVRRGDEVVYTAIIHDVSQRRETEEALRRERDFAERLIDTAQMIVLVLDTEGRIVRFNSYMEKISGYSLQEVQGEDWYTRFLPERERSRVKQVFAAALGENIKGNVNRIVTSDGRERLIEWHATPLRDADGEVEGVLSVGEDITEGRLAEQELQEAHRIARQRERLADIGAITAKVVHDLGNPLAALSMEAQLLLRRARRGDFQPSAPVERPVQQILSTLRRLEALVGEFTDFAREQRLQLEEIQLPRFLQSLVDLWQGLAAGQNVHLSVELAAKVKEIRADDEKLRRVFDNLIKNALDALGKGPGEIVLRTSIPGQGKIRISVEDSGPGIPDELDVFRLFETTKPDGTGIGLAIARQLVATHGGTIEHVPMRPHGTAFHVDLPRKGPTRRVADAPVGS